MFSQTHDQPHYIYTYLDVNNFQPLHVQYNEQIHLKKLKVKNEIPAKS